MSKPKFPVTVKRGHTVVKIYRTPSRGCEAFTVSYYLGDKRSKRGQITGPDRKQTLKQ